ncbi:universal stress protein [Pseudonocardia sp. RS11V-5]|uniref:universal stress protein n=1 Tax=Pseudonocardia terrae TaxID=2905831 RepID=UPI001E46B891|nr:universal stress protein [Pseudonocardia terrae]MCE3555152.1 universal stress protein [Pseudonocardia terrae]
MTASDHDPAASDAGRGEIVVGVDGSPSSLQALRWAMRQSELTGAPVRAVSAWSIPVHHGPMVVAQVWSDWPELARQALDVAVRDALPPEQVRVVRTEVAEGNASAVLLDAAKGAELLVVGSRGHGGFVGLLLGSTAQHVTTHAHCPVLVVHESS